MIAINIICLAVSSFLVWISYKNDFGNSFWANTLAVLFNLTVIILILSAS